MEMQKVTDGMVVSLRYVLVADGEEVARVENDDPMEYLHGAEDILPGLESALEGKTVGDTFRVTLPPTDAYGDYDKEEIEEIDRDAIPNAEELELGMMVEVEITLARQNSGREISELSGRINSTGTTMQTSMELQQRMPQIP